MVMTCYYMSYHKGSVCNVVNVDSNNSKQSLDLLTYERRL